MGQLTQREKSTGEITQYIWNDRNQLLQVLLPSGELVTYKYDGAGRLIGRTDAESNDIFTQSGWDIIAETDKNKVKTYYTGLSSCKDRQIIDGKDRLYYHYDHLGNTRLITDNNGNLVAKYYYEAYGKIINESGNPINSLFLNNTPNLFIGSSGIRYDLKTDLNYMRLRWYSNSLMSFISSDVVMFLNRYRYVSNNPVNRVDYNGAADSTISGPFGTITFPYSDPRRECPIKNPYNKPITNVLQNIFNFHPPTGGTCSTKIGCPQWVQYFMTWGPINGTFNHQRRT
jgi:RHS repeat-associated protein